MNTGCLLTSLTGVQLAWLALLALKLATNAKICGKCSTSFETMEVASQRSKTPRDAQIQSKNQNQNNNKILPANHDERERENQPISANEKV